MGFLEHRLARMDNGTIETFEARWMPARPLWRVATMGAHAPSYRWRGQNNECLNMKGERTGYCHRLRLCCCIACNEEHGGAGQGKAGCA